MNPQKRKKRSVTMYNLVFPVFLIFSPISMIMLPFMVPFWGLAFLAAIVGGNLLIDWLVTALALRWQKIPDIKRRSLAALVRVCLAGFAADIIGSLILFIIMLVPVDWIQQNIAGYFLSSIYNGPYALAVTLAVIFLVGALIYRFNKNWALEPANLEERQRKRTALTLAILTAPYLFLLPARWFY